MLAEPPTLTYPPFHGQSEPEPAETAKPRKAPQFTKENAREFQARSAAARRAKKLAAEQRLIELSQIVANSPAVAEDNYIAQRIARTRKQIEEIDKKLGQCDEPKEIKSLCDALARLAEIERILSGRPLPGALRPAKTKPQKATVNVNPLED